MWLKAGLFLVLGVTAAGLLWWQNPTWRTAVWIALALWACCRAYYFAFYVIQHYIDPAYRFSGLGSFLRYWWQRRRPR